MFPTNIEISEKEAFRQSILADNITRGRIFAGIIIVIEIVLAAIDITTSILKVSSQFHFSAYFFAYMLMILVSTAFLLYLNRAIKFKNKSAKRFYHAETVILIYITFILSWGSFISLMDQKRYGQLMVFMVNMITCSVSFVFERRKTFLSYTVSLAILFIGLPFFQQNSNILIGDYVNISVFVAISWVCSRVLSYHYCNDFNNKSLLGKANRKLEELSLFDELTSLPNRRSYVKHMEAISDSILSEKSQLSVIMMDIDFFKQFNDLYGHKAGDECLIQVGAQIHSVVKDSADFAARLGGEEFIYISTSANEEKIGMIAETIRAKIADLKIPHSDSNNEYLSISLGTSTVHVGSKKDLWQCIELADKALYFAKSEGRNCVKISNGSIADSTILNA